MSSLVILAAQPVTVTFRPLRQTSVFGDLLTGLTQRCYTPTVVTSTCLASATLQINRRSGRRRRRRLQHKERAAT